MAAGLSSRGSCGCILGVPQPSLAVQSTFSKWGEKTRPHCPIRASFAGGCAGVAQRVISNLDASSVLTAARGASARLVRRRACRSIVSHPERLYALRVLPRSGTARRWRACCGRPVLACAPRQLLNWQACAPQAASVALELGSLGEPGFRRFHARGPVAELAVPDGSCTASIATFDPLRAEAKMRWMSLSISWLTL